MIGLDTNVVVRYVAQDDARQSAAASGLMERQLSASNPGFVSLVTLCEIAWVLEECYNADHARLHDVLEALLGTKQLEIETPDLVRKALRAWKSTKADFSDALIGEIALAQGASHVVTFDKAAARLPGFKLLD